MPWARPMSSKRKLQRLKKKKAKKEIKDKVMSFDRMPECCVMCYEPFDKSNKEHRDTWIVVERREQKRVSLFCPKCWENGLATVKEGLYKKQSALDKYFLDKEDTAAILKKRHPQKQDYPDVEDYIIKGEESE